MATTRGDGNAASDAGTGNWQDSGVPPPESEETVRVAIVQRVLPGYRVPVFRRLAEHPGVDLTLFHGTNPRDLARGNTDRPAEGFDRVMLPTVAIKLFGLHLVWFRELLDRVRSGEYDVVVCPASPSLVTVVVLAVLSRLLGRPNLVWWGKSLGQKATPGPVGEALRIVADRFRCPLYRAGDAVVCYSTAAAEYFQSYGVRPADTFVAYNSTDTQQMHEYESRYRDDPEALADLRGRYDADERDVLFFVGTHTPEKHVENLLAVQRRLLEEGFETRLVVAGSGPLTDDFRSEAATIPHTTFTGYVDDEELVRHLLVAEVFVMPGHGGLAVQQAMTLGLPVVTTPLDGSERDLIDEGANGHLVADDDVDALLEGVRRVLEASDIEREAMGRRSAEIVEKTVNVDAMVDGFVAAFERATGKSLATDES